MRTKRSLVLMLVVASAAGCSVGEGPVRSASFRLVEEDPTEIFRRSEFVQTDPVTVWSLDNKRESGAWVLNVAADEVALRADGVEIQPERQYVRATRDVDLDAGEVDAFKVYLKGIRKHPLDLFWAGEGEPFDNQRRVRTEFGRPVGQGVYVYDLVTGGHPGWRGRITTLSLGITLSHKRFVVLRSVEAVTEKVPEGRVEDMLGRSWKVDLGGDLRNAVLASASAPIRRRVTVPADSELRFSYGLQERTEGPVRFRVSAAGAGEDSVLWNGELGELDQWRDARIDLDAFEGRTVDLELLVESPVSFDPTRGFPVWANVEVVSPAPSVPYNVLLISIDTLRADRLSLYGHDRETSPNIDRWAHRRAVVFENVVAPAPWTLPSHASMFTGIDAHRHGVNHGDNIPLEITTLGEAFRAAGYATLAVTGGGFVHANYGFGRGFDSYFNPSVLDNSKELEQGIERVLAEVDRLSDRPFLVFFHTYEVHNPFRPRQPYFSTFSDLPADSVVDIDMGHVEAEDGFLDRHRKLVVMRDGEKEPLPPEERDLVLDLYDSEIGYTDAALGRLLSRLEELGIAERTVVVITSDHGEMFGEHGLYNHTSLYDENLMVPLVIGLPGGEAAGLRVKQQVRLVDLMPTLLELAGILSPGGMNGVSLLPLVRDGSLPSSADRAWSYASASNFGISIREANRLKYVLNNNGWRSPLPAERFSDLDTDPGEQNTVVDPESPDVQRLREATDRELREGVPGVRVMCDNRAGQAPLRCVLKGDSIRRDTVKITGFGRSAFERLSHRVAQALVPPGEVVEATVEVGRPGSLRVRVSEADDHNDGAQLDFDFVESSGTMAVVDRDGVWSVEASSSGPESGRRGVFVSWFGRSVDTAAVVRDEEVQEQLRALGYLQ